MVSIILTKNNMKLRCNRCKEEYNVILKPKIRAVPEGIFKDPNDKRNPKYTIMVKAICPNCSMYLKFVKQTDEVVEELNNYFDRALPY